jgi:tRNA pseudouridine65 synthase
VEFCIVYEDPHCVVVDKPAGVIVHRGWAQDSQTLLKAIGRRLERRVFPVHRLDRGTSGAVLFALDEASARELGRAFAERRVGKAYLALTRGHPPEEGIVDHPVPKAPGEERVPAVTAFRRHATFGRYALVELRPQTGRLHQIRRHMKHISCPLIGDVRYGKGEHNRIFREKYALHRLALHAFALAFEHPATGQRTEVRVPVSGELRECLDRIGLLPAAAALTGEGDLPGGIAT